MSDAALISSCARSSLWSRWARRQLMRRFADWSHGRLEIKGCVGEYSWQGDRSTELSAVVRIHSPRFLFRLAGGSVALAESYLQGEWSCDNLTQLFRLVVRNGGGQRRFDRGWSHVTRGLLRLWHLAHDNSLWGSKRNIAAHYDLGNDFFALMLDETWSYSCGIFPHAGATLEEASQEKMRRIAACLALSPGVDVLEIGTGWGGLALHLAEQHGCRVTTTTISRQQIARAAQRFRASPAADRLHLLDKDYRELTGTYDRLVSVEMIEAVGYKHLPTYFRRCSELLKPDGRCVLQAIIMNEQHYEEYLRSVDFIQRYVFPGGCLPSLGTMLSCIRHETDLRLVHLQDYSEHYAETLRQWRQRFQQHEAEVRRLGYDDRFIRLWNYYLSYCEAGFMERCTGVVQVVLDKPLCRLPSPVACDVASLREP
ncbi:MAG: cyclopropane-fatty-acyl-phospholipid synthase [Planctomycetaceae bacterium]|nr:MAG: cyclopropane-fatty-acyl-phospholipid synthase [Planctomycetaceae bacterium]